MDARIYRQAAEALAGAPVSIESDGTVWHGPDDDRTYLDTAAVVEGYEQLCAEKQAARLASLAKLEALGLTQDDLAALGL